MQVEVELKWKYICTIVRIYTAMSRVPLLLRGKPCFETNK